MEFDCGLVWRNIPQLLEGLRLTVLSFAIALAIGLPLGAVVCAGRLREGGLLSALAAGYVTVFRTLPEIVLVFWLFYCLPQLLGHGVPGLWAGAVALGLAGAAYLCEIFRAGVRSVQKGQWEAATALALPRRTVWTHVVVPQAARLAIPPFINYLTELLKGTTLLATIGVAELALKAYALGAQTFRYMEFLTAIAVFYFLVIFPVARLAEHVERRLGGGRRPVGGPVPPQALFWRQPRIVSRVCSSERTPASEPRPEATSPATAWAKRMPASGASPWCSPAMKPASKASPQPVVSTIGMS